MVIERDSGFTYLTVLIIIALMGVGLALAGEVWHTAAMRDKEAELLFVGNQYRNAISLYYESTPGAVKRYPRTLEELLKDERYPTVRRYLRSLYPDPVTGKPEWGIIKAPDGGVMGVYSLSEEQPFKAANFRPRDKTFEGAAKYSDWKFAYLPQAAAKPGAKPSAPGTGAPAIPTGPTGAVAPGSPASPLSGFPGAPGSSPASSAPAPANPTAGSAPFATPSPSGPTTGSMPFSAPAVPASPDTR
jgi:type II secretory pathway pseudopilin PulG